MPRSIWKGAVSFGLVTIPVKLYSATEQRDVAFHQVHVEDGGRIRYRRVCEKCGEEVAYSEIAKGYEAPDGRVAVLEKDDLADLPLPSAKQVEVVQFVETSAIDPTYVERTYYLEAEGPGAKPYVLLRDALAATGRSALVKVALRSRESLALIRAVEEVLVLHTMLWPDEIRSADFAAPAADVTVSEAEVTMAEGFIEALSGEFDPGAHSDSYREALEQIVAQKLDGIEPVEGEEETPRGGEVVDLVAALRASVEAAKKRRAESEAESETDSGDEAEQPTKKKPTKKATTRKATTKKAASTKEAARKAG